MKSEMIKISNESEIRKLIEGREKAVRNEDVNALMSDHTADVLTFDVLDPLQNCGKETITERTEKWFASYQSSIGYEIRDLRIKAGDVAAFCHYLYRVNGILKDGGKMEMWVRATVCFSKIDGKWKIVHEHNSVPFDGETGKASLDLKP